jgi:anaerobic magnesium-protoporphyrin IX monomethyl ester cyclase
MPYDHSVDIRNEPMADIDGERSIDVAFLQPQGYNSLGFPFGIAILANVLKANGFSVTIVDASANNLSSQEAVERIIALNPRLVGITSMAHSSQYCREVSYGLDKNRPDIIQIAGGAWVNEVEEFVLRHTALDYVVTGEAEDIIAELVDTLLNSDEVPSLPGLSYLKDGEFVEVLPEKTTGTGKGFMFIPRKSFVQVPYPAYDLIDMTYYTTDTTPEEYAWFSRVLPRLRKEGKAKQHLRVGCITSGRGCFGKCDFCGAARTARRNSDPWSIIMNMKNLMDTYGVNTFLFMESLTFSSAKWVKSFCEAVIQSGLDIYYIAISRGDFRYDEELLELLNKSGCVAINIGFESGSNDMLRAMNKEVTVEQYWKIYEDFMRHEIAVFGQFVTNMPGETPESLALTAKFVEETKMHFTFGAAHPYADSQLFHWARERGFCDVPDVMFTSENKGKFSRDEVDYYIHRWNFNGFDFDVFYKSWQRLNYIKYKNSLYHKGKYVRYWLADHMPVPLFIFGANVLSLIKLTRHYMSRTGEILSEEGVVRGTGTVFEKFRARLERKAPSAPPRADISSLPG